MNTMNDYFDTLNDEEKLIYSAIAESAFRLGYKAKKDKSKSVSYTFTHPKIKQRILRFSSDKGKPIIKLKFFASKDYSDYFHEAIRTVIEEYDYRYTGCYGCGRCHGTDGYTYKYSDGKEFYRCGSELVDLADIKRDLLTEVLTLFEKQHGYYLSNVEKNR